MNIEIKEIVDSMYCDFDWYGKFSAKDMRRFRVLLRELVDAMEEIN